MEERLPLPAERTQEEQRQPAERTQEEQRQPASGHRRSSANGGAAGEGGTTKPEVGTVGTECSKPGALQCADTHQRSSSSAMVTGRGKPSIPARGSILRYAAGATLGSCQDPHPDCVDKEPGYRWCHNHDVYECGADLLTSDVVEDCEYFCWEGECVVDEPCPSENWINCSTDCTNAEYACNPRALWGETSNCARVWRRGLVQHRDPTDPAAAEACSCADGRRSFFIEGGYTNSPFRLTIDPPWGIFATAPSLGATSQRADNAIWFPSVWMWPSQRMIPAPRRQICTSNRTTATRRRLSVRRRGPVVQPLSAGTNWVDCSGDCSGSKNDACVRNVVERQIYVHNGDWSLLETIRMPPSYTTYACDNGMRQFYIETTLRSSPSSSRSTRPGGLRHAV